MKKFSIAQRTVCVVVASLLLASPMSALAQIKLGSVTGVTGAQAAGVADVIFAAKLVFDDVNSKGGINGQKIEWKIVDDKFDPAETKKLLPDLLADKNIVALFTNRGTPNSQAAMPFLEAQKIALLAPGTGAMLLHQPVNPYIFNVRPPYRNESEKAVVHAYETGATRVGIIASADTFGDDAVEGAQIALKRLNKKPVFVHRIDRTTPDVDAVIKAIRPENPQRILFFGTGGSVAAIIKAMRKEGIQTKVTTLSNNASSGFIAALGPIGVGTVVMQVFPNERDLSIPVIAELTKLAEKAGKQEITPLMVDGFTSAKVMVAALKNAKIPITRDSVRESLESLSVDVGGMKIEFSPSNHTGLRYSDISIIGADARFRR